MRNYIVVAAALSALFLTPRLAGACGGFFCNAQLPVDQAGEHIVFAVDPASGVVTMHVQIAYTGPSEEFAWLLPLPAEPELFVSSDFLFSTLDQSFAPRFFLNTTSEGECDDGCGLFGCDDMLARSDSVSDDDTGDDDYNESVDVLQERPVGPYETVVLRATSAAVLLDWLQEYGYDLPDELAPRIAPYVDGQATFVALRLQKDRDDGDLQPLGLRYAGGTIGIPIRLTAVAAMPDMPLFVYLLGHTRGIPENYLHVQINEAAIDWLGAGVNYAEVVTMAADEAGGQAFATDFAGPTSGLEQAFYRDGQYDTARLASEDDPIAFFDEMMSQGFIASNALLDLLREFIPKPASVASETDFYNCLSCYASQVRAQPFDAEAFAAALEAQIVAPLMAAQELVDDYPYVTRFTSSMSADEMTTDPIFAFNPDLPVVSNDHTATLVFECNGATREDAPRRLDLADGRSIVLPPISWNEEQGRSDNAYLSDLGSVGAVRVEALYTSGAAEIVVDRSAELLEQVEAYNERIREEADLGGCACRSGGGGAEPVWLAFVVAGIWLTRRRSPR